MRKKPKMPKRPTLLDRIIFKGEWWLYEQERILEDSKKKSQIFNNMASVRVKQSQVALNKARLKRIELQNQFLELTLANARKNGDHTPLELPEPANTVYCFKCKTFYPPDQLACCGSPTVILDQIKIGENHGK